MKEILSDKIDDGFAFPLNPKWILCDEGWKDLYDKLLASEAPNVQGAVDIWYPADVRERIAAISSKYPVGFGSSDGHEDNTSEGLGFKRMKRRSAQVDYEKFSAEIAELELERYKHAKSGMWKLRTALLKTKKPKKKARKVSFVSCVLLMNQNGKEADAQKKCAGVEAEEFKGREKSGSKKLLNIIRRRSSVDSQSAISSIASVTSEGSSSSKADGIDIQDSRPLRLHRRSITNYFSKRLSSKMQRRGSGKIFN